jgi:hypothetical protein
MEYHVSVFYRWQVHVKLLSYSQAHGSPSFIRRLIELEDKAP